MRMIGAGALSYLCRRKQQYSIHMEYEETTMKPKKTKNHMMHELTLDTC